MDSITHSLYRAISTEHQVQIVKRNSIATHGVDLEKSVGLAPLCTRPGVHEGYAGAAPTDLHINLPGGSPDILCVQMEFIAAGFAPPAAMAIDGAEVIISTGHIELFVSTDDGNGTWTATLSTSNVGNGIDPGFTNQPHRVRKTGWVEQIA